MAPVRFGIVGVGGYARSYHTSISKLQKEGLARLVAVAENNQSAYRDQLADMLAQGTRIYDDFSEMLQREKVNLDFVALPIGIHLHATMTIEALKAGCHVICEKPVAATVQEVDRMIALTNKMRAIVIIGYQEIFSPSIRMLKVRIMNGRLGRVRSAKVKGGWPRSDSYYSRNNWAGKLRLGKNWVLDGIAMNAMAHYINNMLFLASQEPKISAIPNEVQAELYRAHPIESYDTITLRAKTNSGSQIYFVATHAPENESHPQMSLQCENGEVKWRFEDGATTIHYEDGSEEHFDNQNSDIRTEVFRNAIACVRGKDVPRCTLEMGRSHTLCMNGVHESCPQIISIPSDQIMRMDILDEAGKPTGDVKTIIRDVDALMEQAFSESKLFSELNVPWAQRTRAVSLDDYTRFPSQKWIHQQRHKLTALPHKQ